MAQVRIRRATEEGTPSGYTVNGPATGEVRNVPLNLQARAVATRYNVALVPPYSTTIITPQSADPQTTFSPPSLTLSSSTPTGTIDVSPGSTGVQNIVFTNNRSLPNVTKQLTVQEQVGFNIFLMRAGYTDPGPYEEGMDLCVDKMYGEYDPGRPWSCIHKVIVDDPVDPHSDGMINDMWENGNFNDYPPHSFYFNLMPGYAFPWLPSSMQYGRYYNVIRGGTVTPVNIDFFYASSLPHLVASLPWPIPPIASASMSFQLPPDNRDSGFDQQLWLYDPDNDKAYEFYAAYTQNGGQSWIGHAGWAWDLATGDVTWDQYITGNACGAPYLPLTPRYDEYARYGGFHHALACTTHVYSTEAAWPAKASVGAYNLYPARAVPWGARFRLREDYYEANKHLYSGVCLALFETMRNYGMIMIDGSNTFSIGMMADVRWPWQTCVQFDQYWIAAGYGGAPLPLNAFEVLEVPVSWIITGPSGAVSGQKTGPWRIKRRDGETRFDVPVYLIGHNPGLGDVMTVKYPGGQELTQNWIQLSDANREAEYYVTFGTPGERQFYFYSPLSRMRATYAQYGKENPPLTVTVTSS